MQTSIKKDAVLPEQESRLLDAVRAALKIVNS